MASGIPDIDWSALEQLPVWAQAGALSAPRERSGNSEFLATAWLETKTGRRLAVYLLAAQHAKATFSEVHVDLVLTSEKTQNAENTQRCRSQRLVVEVPGVDVAKEPFQKLSAAAGGRGLLFFASSSCAVTALPLLDDFEGTRELHAVPISQPFGTSFVKAMWHPLSDAHLGVLCSDGSWSLLNLSSASLQDPEVHIPKVFENHKEEVVDFTFMSCFGDTPEEAWLGLSVLFLGSSGFLSLRNPVLPSTAAIPQKTLHGLAADPNDWLHKVLEGGSDSFAIDGFSSMCVLRHRLHLHAEGHVVPGEQVLKEAPDRVPQSPQSAKHARSPYCSVQLLTHSPLVIIARGTTSGLLELLALDSVPGPDFAGGTIAASVLEEIDLMCSTSAFQILSVSKDLPSFVVHSSSLVALVDVRWLRDSGSSGSANEPSAVTTLAEVRAQEASSFAGWQQVDNRGLLLRAERKASRSFSLQTLEVKARCKEPGREAEGEVGEVGEVRRPAAFRRLLTAPMPVPKLSARAKLADLAQALANLRGGALGNLSARQDLLEHLNKTLPPRVQTSQEDLKEMSQGLQRRAYDGALRASVLRERQLALCRRQERLVEALRAELETLALNAASTELPRLFSRFHDLCRAFELLKSGLRASPTAQKEFATQDRSTTLATTTFAAGLAGVAPRLGLQQAWAGATKEHLQLRAAEAEAAVDEASARLTC